MVNGIYHFSFASRSKSAYDTRRCVHAWPKFTHELAASGSYAAETTVMLATKPHAARF